MANSLNLKQAKNLAKRLRLARATTGDEQMKHYSEIEKMIVKYNIVIPEFNLKETIERVDEYAQEKYEEAPGKNKVFYKHNQLQGWRFYVKAILNLDFESLFAHIKGVYLK